MNHQILQDSIGLQREVKSLLAAIGKGKEGGSTMGQLSKRPDKKWSKHEDSKEIEQVKMKQPVKCWGCGGCCNLTDHIRLPIIHTKTYININRDKR